MLDKILVYFILHDQKNARLYEHYALVEGEKWTYYRHHVANFDIVYKEMNLLIFHSFARNILTVYASELLKRLQKAIATLSISFTLSFSANTRLLIFVTRFLFCEMTLFILCISSQRTFCSQRHSKLFSRVKEQKFIIIWSFSNRFKLCWKR